MEVHKGTERETALRSRRPEVGPAWRQGPDSRLHSPSVGEATELAIGSALLSGAETGLSEGNPPAGGRGNAGCCSSPSQAEYPDQALGWQQGQGDTGHPEKQRGASSKLLLLQYTVLGTVMGSQGAGSKGDSGNPLTQDIVTHVTLQHPDRTELVWS